MEWDGCPCCFDKDAKYQLGDLKKDSFKEIWHNQNYQQFRSQILKGRDQIDICKNCTEGCKVWEKSNYINTIILKFYPALIHVISKSIVFIRHLGSVCLQIK
jgi:MoaA/NifB/PqqE/SkfB family radical SAM enzyme